MDDGLPLLHHGSPLVLLINPLLHGTAVYEMQLISGWALTSAGVDDDLIGGDGVRPVGVGSKRASGSGVGGGGMGSGTTGTHVSTFGRMSQKQGRASEMGGGGGLPPPFTRAASTKQVRVLYFFGCVCVCVFVVGSCVRVCVCLSLTCLVSYVYCA